MSALLTFERFWWRTRACYYLLITLLYPQLATLDTLSSDQKAELILDPSSGALENATVLKEVFVTIAGSPEDGQLDGFFQTFIVLTAQVSVPYWRAKLDRFPYTVWIGTGQIYFGAYTVPSSIGVSLFSAKHHLHYQRRSERCHAEPDADSPDSQIPQLPTEPIHPVV